MSVTIMNTGVFKQNPSGGPSRESIQGQESKGITGKNRQDKNDLHFPFNTTTTWMTRINLSRLIIRNYSHNLGKKIIFRDTVSLS